MSFQGVNNLFVLSYEDNAHQTSYKWCFLPTVEVKDCNVTIDGRNLCLSVPSYFATCELPLPLILKSAGKKLSQNMW